MEVTFFGHSAFQLKSAAHTVVIDPFISENPLASIKAEQLSPNAILLTHGHGDHLGDVIEISKRCGSLIIAPFELASYCQSQGANTHGMNIGGSYPFDFGKVKMTTALHSSAIVGETIVYTGNPCGYLVTMQDKTVYHAGDTGLFGDMELIGRRHPIDLALLPIGDNFVMGIDDAVAAVEMLKPRRVVPIHYNTFELIQQDPEEFKRKVGGMAECIVMQPGDELTI